MANCQQRALCFVAQLDVVSAAFGSKLDAGVSATKGVDPGLGGPLGHPGALSSAVLWHDAWAGTRLITRSPLAQGQTFGIRQGGSFKVHLSHLS
jgi:hypothetical protein